MTTLTDEQIEAAIEQAIRSSAYRMDEDEDGDQGEARERARLVVAQVRQGGAFAEATAAAALLWTAGRCPTVAEIRDICR